MKFKEWLQTLPVEKLDEFAAAATATSPLWLPKVLTAIGAAGTLYNMTKKKNNSSDKVNYPEKPEKPTPKDGESWDSGKRYVRNGKPVPTRNLSGRYKTYKRNLEKRKNFQDKLTSSSPGAEFKPDNSVKPGDNPEARKQIRDMLNKNKNKNK